MVLLSRQSKNAFPSIAFDPSNPSAKHFHVKGFVKLQKLIQLNLGRADGG